MAQPSVACYFTNRKRSAIDELKVQRARKTLKLDGGECKESITDKSDDVNLLLKKIDEKGPFVSDEPVDKVEERSAKISGPTKNVAVNTPNGARKVIRASKTNKLKDEKQRGKDIKDFVGNMSKSERCATPPRTPTKEGSARNELDQIKKKLCRSSRLAELKASIGRFNESANQLKEAEKRTAAVSQSSQSPKLKSFRNIEIEVQLSPQKAQSPEKAYLSPKKESSVRRNLLNCLSPTKNLVALPESPAKQILESTSKPALKLPFKYRYLAEIFGAIDVVSQIMFNRKETITYKKLKPGVEKMLKRNLLERHIAQIKGIYPAAYRYSMEKLKVFGTGTRQEEWELVLTPCFDGNDKMTETVVLERKRKMFKILLDKVKDYHDEFLKSLTPPMLIPKDKITRWHPEFDIERVPDVELSDVPQPPVEEKLTGKQILEKARQMFSCNTRMEQALARLQAAKEANAEPKETPHQPESILKGIPKALLEKVRQRQAAKALASMTRSEDKDKEVQLYSRLPEIARLARSLFVAEKKAVLPLDTVLEKLGNSYRCFLTKTEMEIHLKTISKEVPGWLVFHNVRNSVYLKLAKDADLSLVLSKLENLAKEKNDA